MTLSDACEARHRVQFYSDPVYLADQIASFVADALRKDGSSILIVRPDHRSLIESKLATRELDVNGLQASERLLILDADATLASFMVAGVPEHAQFAKHVGALVEKVVARGGPVRCYGEMVDLLWANGNSQAALTLETYWIELLERLPCELLCGYRIERFDRNREGLQQVCAHHGAMQYDERSVVLLEHRARALEIEVQRRIDLERRMLKLLDVTGSLAGARTREEIGRLTIVNGVQAVEAVQGALWLVGADRDHVDLLVGIGEGAEAQYSRMARTSDTPLGHVLRTGEAVFLGTRDAYRERFPASYERVLKSVPNLRAFVALPVMADHELLGGIVFGYDHERTFAGPDRAFKTILARQCALALERVQLHQEERALREDAERAAAAEKRARGDAELLYQLTSAVNGLDEIDAVHDLALDTVMRGSRCDRAAILMFDQEGVMRFVASRGLSETYRSAVEGHSPWRRDAQDAVPIAVDDTESDPAWEPYRPVFRAEGIRSLAFVPLLHQRKLLGKFMLYRNEPCAFEARELQLASTAAAHVAQAFERHRSKQELARAYREEHEARMQADEAIRAREEILSVVSHDLRGPLGTVMLGATSLLELGDRSVRTRMIAERIHRQAERMARLIEDLVDFAGIQAGKLAIARSTHKPEDIITATSDMFGPLATEHGLRFETRVFPNLPAIDCDSERAVQVLSNLVANALKVTPKGGAIAIGAEPKDNEVVFFVRDTGPGISAEELPRLFERYWRSAQPSYKGAGLGLSIARGIVDAHGGRIWAESQLGVGSTFYFSLHSLRSN